MYTIRKNTEKQANKKDIKHKKYTKQQHIVQTEKYENYFSIKWTAQTVAFSVDFCELLCQYQCTID